MPARLRSILRDTNPFVLTVRELAFRAYCRHRQGEAKNIFLYCTRRGGSTWILNTLAAHPGMRYVGKPFWALLRSRWRHLVPSLAEAAGKDPDYRSDLLIQFEGEALDRILEISHDIATARKHIYPTLNVRAPYFHRVTNRAVFQITTATAMIEVFHKDLPVETLILLRHPISNALSIMQRGWPPQASDFIRHQPFVETHLTGGQVDLANDILGSGSLLAQHVLDWSLKVLLPIRLAESEAYPSWTKLTYEETVLRPASIVELLATRLSLPDVETMMAQVERPSRTVAASTAERVRDPEFLIGRWMDRIGPEERRDLMRIPATFGLDVYRADDRLPKRSWLFHADACEPPRTTDSKGVSGGL